MDAPRILLMRHAEKSDDPQDPHLSADGQARAARLADYVPATFGRPDVLIATAVSKHSSRPLETLQPLSDKIGVAIDATFADQDYGALAEDLLSRPSFKGRLVVVCWHHGNIPSMAHALRAADGSYPDPWNKHVFNLILRFSYAAGDAPDVTQVAEPF
jgi:phosphohistidine phosphatase SixA